MSSCSQKPFYTIVPLKLDFAAEKGGMAVSAVWRLVYFLAPYPSEPKEQTAAHRRDALCPSTKIQKQADFGITAFYQKVSSENGTYKTRQLTTPPCKMS